MTWFDTDRCPGVAIPAPVDDRRADRGYRIRNMTTPVGFDGRGRHAPPPVGVSVPLAPLAKELQSLKCVDRARDLAFWDFLMSGAASLKGTGFESARGSFSIFSLSFPGGAGSERPAAVKGASGSARRSLP